MLKPEKTSLLAFYSICNLIRPIWNLISSNSYTFIIFYRIELINAESKYLKVIGGKVHSRRTKLGTVNRNITLNLQQIYNTARKEDNMKIGFWRIWRLPTIKARCTVSSVEDCMPWLGTTKKSTGLLHKKRQQSKKLSGANSITWLTH